jgi:uncharacterized protein
MVMVPLQQPFTAGLHRLRAPQVHVSRGKGYWGPSVRLGAPSAITLNRLVRVEVGLLDVLSRVVLDHLDC